MDFSYSEEQRMLADSLRRFVDHEYTFAHRRKSARNGIGFDRDVWSNLASMGVAGLTIEAQYDGFDQGVESYLVVNRELGRGLVHEPVIPVTVAAAILSLYGTQEQKAEWLPGIACGDSIVVPAYSESGSRYELDSVATVALPAEEGYVIHGEKTVVWHAQVADAYIVSARLGSENGDIRLFLVPRESQGLDLVVYPTIDDQRAADVTFNNVRVSADALIHTQGAGDEALRVCINHGIIALCAQALGAMERLIEITTDYLRVRQQFGKPLAAFQALQHRVADMLIQKELAGSAIYIGIQGLSEPDASKRERMIATAKLAMIEAARFVGQQAVQLHGGIGMTDELEVSDYFRFLTMCDPIFGDHDYHAQAYADAMEE